MDCLNPCETANVGIQDQLHLTLSCLTLNDRRYCYLGLSIQIVAADVNDFTLVELLITKLRWSNRKPEPMGEYRHSFSVTVAAHSNLVKELLVS